MSSSLLVLVTGPPASGKSTLARDLAEVMSLPLIAKDDIKEILFDSLGYSDTPWSKKLGSTTYMILFHVMKEHLRAGQSLIIESNLRPAEAEPQLASLSETYSPRIVQVYCTAPPDVLAQRFEERANSPERHPGHVDALNTAEFKSLLEKDTWGKLSIGETIEVDTTNPNSISAAEISATIRASVQ